MSEMGFYSQNNDALTNIMSYQNSNGVSGHAPSLAYKYPYRLSPFVLGEGVSGLSSG